MDEILKNNSYKHFDAKSYELIQTSKIPEVLSTSERSILKILSDNDKYIVDLGAGYGRLLDIGVIDSFGAYIGIENNESMYKELIKKSSEGLRNYAYKGDLNDFKSILKEFSLQEKKPIFTLLQNTLGTLQGDRMKLIEDLSNYLSTFKSECVFSLLKQSCLKKEGLKFLESINFMIGDLDYKETNISKGIIKTNAGYVSQRRREDQIVSIKKTMKEHHISEYVNKYGTILHVTSNRNAK